MYNNRPYRPGYAIAEVLLAMVIISISFLQLSQSLRTVMGAAKQNVFVTRAINIANSTMEEVMAQSFDEKGSEAGGYVLDFDGTGDYVDIGDVHEDIQTISFWIQANAVGGTRNVIDLNSTAYISIVAGEVTAVGIASPTYYLNAIAGEQTIKIGIWYHVAVTTATPVDAGDAGDVDIGRVVTAAGSDVDYFNGKIDEVRLWDDERDSTQIRAYYNRNLPNPYNNAHLKLYLRMNNGEGIIAFDHSSSMAHGTLEDDPTWTSQSSSWSTTLGTEDKDSWSEYNDVDDFNGVSEEPDDIYTGITKTITVVYVDIHPTTWAITNPSGSPSTDYKEITVRVDIPGGDSYTQLRAIKSAKTIQNYTLTYSPYGN